LGISGDFSLARGNSGGTEIVISNQFISLKGWNMIAQGIALGSNS
jgi:hypothetical protein